MHSAEPILILTPLSLTCLHRIFHWPTASLSQLRLRGFRMFPCSPGYIHLSMVLYGQTSLKMFDGVQNLFQLFEAEGHHVFGRSERSEVFRFLDFESCITARDSQAKSQHLGSLAEIIESLTTPADQPKFAFLHFWYTRGGYGLSGVRNAPNLGAMVKAG